MNCPEKASYCGVHEGKRSVMRRGSVEGVAVSDIPLDTGCTQTMVQRNLVGSAKFIEGVATTVRCVHGDNVLYPLADVVVGAPGGGYTRTGTTTLLQSRLNPHRGHNTCTRNY